MNPRNYVVALREFGRVGPKGFQQLLLHFGSPENVFAASPEQIASLPRMTREKALTILKAEDKLAEIDRLIEKMEANQIHIITLLDETYPQLLKEADDPPPLLYYRGNFPAEGKGPAVAIVGTTEPTQPGIAAAVALGKGIAARGGVIVSGLARGIDSAGHVAALAKDGISYAVLGSGLDSVYPPENLTLSQNIASQGAVLSEYQPNVQVNQGQLLARNRIVVGLSQAVILVEELRDKGELSDAAQRALDIGRPLFVVRECSTLPYWQKKGAIPIKGVEDLDLILGYL